jgi:hypothetical protein
LNGFTRLSDNPKNPTRIPIYVHVVIDRGYSRRIIGIVGKEGVPVRAIIRRAYPSDWKPGRRNLRLQHQGATVTYDKGNF